MALGLIVTIMNYLMYKWDVSPLSLENIMPSLCYLVLSTLIYITRVEMVARSFQQLISLVYQLEMQYCFPYQLITVVNHAYARAS